MVGLLVLAAASWTGLLVVTQVLEPSQIGPGAGGHQWVDYHVDSSFRTAGFFDIPCDDNAGTARGALRSDLTLFEDDRPLGPSHSVDPVIGDTGAGAFAYHCLDSGAVRGLAFSTSDNSDPRTNGRHYLVRFSLKLAPPLLAGSLCLVALLAMVGLPGRWLSWWLGGVWLVALAITAQVIAHWLAGPATALLVPDSWSYLHPALSAVTGGPFLITSGRSIGYPGFVLAVLATFGTLPAVVKVQAVLCLLTAALVAAYPMVATIGIRVTPSGRCLRTYLGAGSLLLFFHNGAMDYCLHALIPEMLFITLSALILILLILVFRLASPRWILVGCAVGLYLTVANFYVKPSWGVAMLFSGGLFALRLLFVAKAAPLLRVSVLVGSALLALTTLVWTNARLSETYDRHSYKIFGPITLLCHQAPLVIASLDRHRLDDQSSDQPLLTQIREDLADIVARGPGPDNYLILGYDPNLCLYGIINDHLEQAFGDDPDRIAQLLLGLFRRAVIDDPLAYWIKVKNHAWAIISQPLVDFALTTSFNDRSLPPAALLNTVGSAAGLFADHRPFTGVTAPPLASDFGLAVLDGLGKLLWEMMLLGVVLLTGELIWPDAGRKSVIRRWIPAVLASGLLVGALLVVAVSNTADVPRYRYPLFPLALGTAALLLQVLVAMIHSRVRQGVLAVWAARYRGPRG